MAGLNGVRFRPLSMVKHRVLKPGIKLRTVKFGLLKGLKLHLDFSTETQIYLRLYETETFSATRELIRRAAWMVDVGAGVGELALYFMKVHGPHTVFAFEPRPEQLARFGDNLAANGWALSDVSMSPDFVGLGEGCTALDALAPQLNNRGLIKIDVDGAEMDVLRSAEGLLRAGAADFLVEVHSKELEEGCIALFKANGYKVDIIPNAWWRLFVPERRNIEHNRWLTAVHA